MIRMNHEAPLAAVPRRVVPRGLRKAVRAFRRKAAFKDPPGGHRPRLRVFASVLASRVSEYRAGTLRWEDGVAYWGFVVHCRCGTHVFRSMNPHDNPRLTLRSVLWELRAEVLAHGCKEALLLRQVAAVMGS